jgi:FkbM family methyltransferase
MSHPNVTVVIPAFGQWEALEACLRSCLECIAPHHTLLIADDASEDAAMGRRVSQILGDRPNVLYFRNTQNEGFLRTCNRAALEWDRSDNDILFLNSDTVVTEGFLEEMQACLSASERHAVCCPRTNSATILTIPQYHDCPAAEFPSISRNCARRMRRFLPRFSLIPTGIGFCMLIRRTVIRNFGLFDEAYGLGYHEENDFCLRINRLGYSSVMANDAFVFHGGGISFGHKSNRSGDHNLDLLRHRYPEYDASLRRYRQFGIRAAEHFADVIGECYPRQRIAFDFSHMPAAHNGTSEYALRLWDSLAPLLQEHADVRIIASVENDAFFKLSARYGSVLPVHEVGFRHFDLIFTPSQIFSHEHLQFLNRAGVRLVHTLHDIISLRCQYLQEDELEHRMRLAARFADGIIHISDASRKDCEQYLGNDLLASQAQRKTILHGTSVPPAKEELPHPFPGDTPFILVLGNAFAHKALSYALPHIPQSHRIAVIGKDESAKESSYPSARFYHSGSLTAETVESLYAHCACVLYPSQYEGFGFPLLHAAAWGKPVIAHDSEVSREVASAFGIESHVHLFRQFEEIPSLLQKALKHSYHPIPPQRLWKECAEETAVLLRSVLSAPVDIAKLEARFSEIQTLRQSNSMPIAQKHETPSADDTSQHGEAAFLRSLLPRNTPRFLVDVGAHDGAYLSNSLPFIQEGWEGVLVEPHPQLFLELTQRHAGNPRVYTVQKACMDRSGTMPLYMGKDGNAALSTLCTDDTAWFRESRSEESIPVEADTLTHILDAHNVPGDFSLLLIDAEGMDYEVLLGLDANRYRPRIILTEEYEDDRQKKGWKFALLSARGYRYHATIGCNTVWLASEAL